MWSERHLQMKRSNTENKNCLQKTSKKANKQAAARTQPVIVTVSMRPEAPPSRSMRCCPLVNLVKGLTADHTQCRCHCLPRSGTADHIPTGDSPVCSVFRLCSPVCGFYLLNSPEPFQGGRV